MRCGQLLAACGGTPVAGAPTTTPQPTATGPDATARATGTPSADVAERPGLAATATLVDATPSATVAPDDRQVSPAGNVLRLDWGVEPEHIDRQKAQGGTPNNFVVLNYLTLMTYDTTLKVVPGAAERAPFAPMGAAAQAQVAPAAWAQAWVEGPAMPLEQAIALPSRWVTLRDNGAAFQPGLKSRFDMSPAMFP